MRNVSGDQKDVFLADATSGAGGGKVGIAGSLALTIANLTTTAELKSSASTLNGGDVSLTATTTVREHRTTRRRRTAARARSASAPARRSTSSTR
jgi:hypothetical protein